MRARTCEPSITARDQSSASAALSSASRFSCSRCHTPAWCQSRSRHHQAIQHYRQAITLRRALGNTTQAADTLDNLGHPHAALGQHAQAGAVWREALELYRQLGRDNDVNRVQRQLDDLDKTTDTGQKID